MVMHQMRQAPTLVDELVSTTMAHAALGNLTTAIELTNLARDSVLAATRTLTDTQRVSALELVSKLSDCETLLDLLRFVVVGDLAGDEPGQG
jgi:hypothetical protein